MPAGRTSVEPRPESAPMESRLRGAGPLPMSQPTLQRDRQRIDYGYEQNVQKLHAVLRHEKGDGRVAIKPFSLWMLVICGFVFFFAGFFLARRPPPAKSSPQVVETVSTSVVQSGIADAAAPGVVQVAMKNMKFSPVTIEIKKGDTVEWKNDDITPHTATSASFDSGPIASDAAWRHTFRQAGSFPYTCTFHPEMKGTVIIK
jgi:plastocyanin